MLIQEIRSNRKKEIETTRIKNLNNRYSRTRRVCNKQQWMTHEKSRQYGNKSNCLEEI